MSEKLTRTQIKNLERLGGVNPADQPFSRRQFVRQVGGYGLVAGGAVGSGLLLRDHWGMEGVKPPPPVRLKDYSVALASSRPSLVIVRSSPVLASDYPSREAELMAREEQALRMVKSALDAMGGVSQFIHKGDVVVIKPNVAFDKNPDLAATTQPDTVAAVTRLCLGAGARKVIVADNPIKHPRSRLQQNQVS